MTTKTLAQLAELTDEEMEQLPVDNMPAWAFGHQLVEFYRFFKSERDRHPEWGSEWLRYHLPIDDAERLWKSLASSCNPYGAAHSAFELALSFADIIGPDRFRKIVFSKNGRDSVVKGRHAKVQKVKEEWIDAALEKLTEQVKSDLYPNGKHIDYLEDLRKIVPFSYTEKDGYPVKESWWEALRKRFILLLDGELRRPDIVKRN